MKSGLAAMIIALEEFLAERRGPCPGWHAQSRRGPSGT
jgi:hypothetical protein